MHGTPGYAAGERLPDIRQMLDGVPPANNPAIRVDKVPGQSFRYSGGGYQVMQAVPQHLSSDHDPLFEFHRWRANLRILDVSEIKTGRLLRHSRAF